MNDASPLTNSTEYTKAPTIELMTKPMDIMINGTLVARGEVVSADGKFGLRLVVVVSPKERLEQLG